MEEAKIDLAPEARVDLLDLEQFIVERDGQRRADLVIARIYRSIRNVADMPGIGTAKPHLGPGIRSLPCRPWSIFYKKLSDQVGIRVIRILDGRRNLSTIFAKNP